MFSQVLNIKHVKFLLDHFSIATLSKLLQVLYRMKCDSDKHISKSGEKSSRIKIHWFCLHLFQVNLKSFQTYLSVRVKIEIPAFIRLNNTLQKGRYILERLL